ncbi:MAG TPA: ferrous iron transport protein A [Nitrososphaeria archaeon]|nr:MAG: ferrous iron transport protein A [Nitrososphaerota archaeon]HDJ66128.1 ferrous iron transport protein A [Nitrososphaeria archaeon]
MTRLMPLAFLSEGEVGTVVEIRAGRGLTGRLLAMGIVPGAKIRVLKSSGPGPILVEIGQTRIALGRGVAMKVMVRGWNSWPM